MRTVALLTIVGALTGCAATVPRPGGPPEHGRGQLFVSPMGEPFRAVQRPGAAQALWFAGADTDGDGRLTLAEFQHDAMRFFAVLDRGKDGEIDPADIAVYENVLVPEIRVGGGRAATMRRPPGARGRDQGSGGGGSGGGGRGGGRGGSPGMQFGDNAAGAKAGATARERQGAARYGFFDLPEPVIAADRDGNRGVDAREFAAAAAIRFAALDRNHDGVLSRGELPRAGAETWRNGSDRPGERPSDPIPDRERPDDPAAS